jgi:DNA-binding NtrC family response regulator
VPLQIPPLRQRRGDIELIARELIARLCAEHGLAPTIELGEAALQALAAHDWPGNVRELRNVLERGLLLAHAGASFGGQLELAPVEFGPGLIPAGKPPAAVGTAGIGEAFEPGLSYRETRARWEAEFERRYASWLLARHDGNVSAAARAADMDRKYLHKLATRHGIK